MPATAFAISRRPFGLWRAVVSDRDRPCDGGDRDDLRAGNTHKKDIFAD